MADVRAALRRDLHLDRDARGTNVRWARDVASEVHELSFAQWVGGIGRLSCSLAPRAECLIYLCFSAARPQEGGKQTGLGRTW